MQHGAVLAALALAVSLTGCQGPENLTSPQSPDNYTAPPTIVQESHLTPSSNNDNQYGGAHSDLPDWDEDDTCEPS